MGHNLKSRFSNIDRHTARAGHPVALLVSVTFVIVWALCGPRFDYSDTWQLVINTATTIITSLMAFSHTAHAEPRTPFRSS
jgi:low affinity Fe/Cu permease